MSGTSRREERRGGRIAASAVLLVGGFAGTFLGPPLVAQMGTKAVKPPPAKAATTTRRPSEPRKLFRVSERSPRYVRGRLLIKFEEGTTARAEARALERAGVETERTVTRIDVDVADVEGGDTTAAVSALKASPVVEYVEREV